MRMLGRHDAWQAPGGGEVQMQATRVALEAVGVDAKLWPSDGVDEREGFKTLEDVDCLHLFGSLPEHFALVEQAHRQGVPVALSTIAWFQLVNCWREPGPAWQRLWRGTKYVARAACPWLPSWRRRLYQAVDLLLPNSQAEAEQLVRYFQIPRRKIRVVPNGANPGFGDATPEPFAEMVGGNGFVLYPGRIEPRKNQLGFLRAMRGTGMPVVVLGDPVPGHEDYYVACRHAADDHVRFVPRLAHDNLLLASAYAACGCLVLASWFETPGLVALEAAMSGTPLVLPRDGCAEEYFGELARYVAPGDARGIRRAVRGAIAEGRNPTLAQLVRDNFGWATTAQVTREAYETIV